MSSAVEMQGIHSVNPSHRRGLKLATFAKFDWFIAKRESCYRYIEHHSSLAS